MSAEMMYEQVLNGAPVTLADLPQLATLNTGHFTAMQIREGKVKGLRLHLERLEVSSPALFGCAVPGEKLLSVAPVSVRQLDSFTAAFAMNSMTAAQPIRQIDDTVFNANAIVFKMLQEAYGQTPWEGL